MLHRSLLPQRAASQLAGKRVNVSTAPRANLRDDVMGAVRKTLAKQTPDTRREAREAEARAAESRRFFYINKPRQVRGPFVAIPAEAVEHLFPGQATGQPIVATLCISIDGSEWEEAAPQVELKQFAGTSCWRINGLKGLSSLAKKMAGLTLEGWQLDEHGRLVAMLRTVTAQAPTGSQNLLQQAQHHVQVGAAAVVAAARNAMERKRTYVPARVRPIANEVFVPYGLWKELFDGSGRPFPANGLPLRVSVTGAVQMAEQPALLVRRITPYGYYVLRGVKGLSKVKGMLLVRWSLLVSGVIEMEVVERPAAEPAPGAVAAAALHAQQLAGMGTATTTHSFTAQIDKSSP
mmetsp:Transcript_4019/g.10000  ORF Transcript_4019/g.10000 Transcript_4019/m.10000 type:complete len:349 (-) Transcript_4019:934-1980(-)|eukprot:CAMPEP_0202866420 /NCGR_PEP_ID=MMETSP1391-20130828/7493_1 /ASSEMBLY_ACC=CAM_ASM_000867 /TAXON_ID=1034604 /ORGANISM="Chlamydomonas leiostraca, Strain SAG 11-49" /LENGTH=348 /DNA_ID=CAMNT_0049546363 /DNA_START=69 /DNA_END=1115 /DNA_ORIENTATION=-